MSPGGTLGWMHAGIGLEPGAATAELDWLIASGLGGGADRAVPAELCLRRPATTGPRPRRPAASSGCAAGPDLPTALLHGLLELIERDAVALWWYGGVPAAAPRLPVAAARTLRERLDALRRPPGRRLWFLDLTTNIGIPVLAALSSTADGRAVACGFAAGADAADAAERAVQELCQIELAQQLSLQKLRQDGPDALQTTDRAHLARLNGLSTARFPELQPSRPPREAAAPDADGGSAPLALCLDGLRRAGLEACFVDLSRPALGIPAVRVLVPGLQAADPAWPSDRLRQARRQAGAAAPGAGQRPAII